MGCSLKRVVAEIESSGLQVERTWRVPEYSYHRFFELS